MWSGDGAEEEKSIGTLGIKLGEEARKRVKYLLVQHVPGTFETLFSSTFASHPPPAWHG